IWRFSDRLHDPDSGVSYTTPVPSTFSFNSPLGACETCRGFGRVIGVDYGLVVPVENKTLREGAVKPWQSPSFKEIQDDRLKYAPAENVRVNVPWSRLTDVERDWVLNGTPHWKGSDSTWKHQWDGARRLFAWLESNAYKMHIRVLLPKYRAYTPCPDCRGSRLKSDALLWRVGSVADAQAVMPDGEGRYRRFKPVHVAWSDAQLNALPGLSIHDLMLLPIERV